MRDTQPGNTLRAPVRHGPVPHLATPRSRQLRRRLLPEKLERGHQLAGPARHAPARAHLRLGELKAVGVPRQVGHACIEPRQTQGLLQQDLPGRARQQVRAPHHVRDALRGVVDDDGQLVGETGRRGACRTKSPTQRATLTTCRPWTAVHELDVPVRHAEPQGCSCGWSGRAPAGIRRDGTARRPRPGDWFSGRAASAARVQAQFAELAIRCKAVERGAIGVEPRALPQHRPVPVQAESVQCGEDVVRGAGLSRGGSRSSIRTSHSPMRAGIEPAGDRRDQRPEVQRAARRRREAPAIRPGRLSGTSRPGRRTAFRAAHGVPAPRRSAWRPGGLRGA